MPTTVASVRGSSTSRKYVLKLRIGDREFEKEFGSWDELRKNKDLIKPYASFNSITKSWEVRDYVTRVDELADVVSKVFNVDREEVKKIVEEHNREVVEKLKRSIRGTPRIAAIAWLDDNTYSLVRKYAEKISNRLFEFSPSKFITAEGVLGKSREDYEKALTSWLDSLEKAGLIFDRDAILAKLSEVMKYVERLRTVRASYVVEKDENGKKRGWIKLEFHPELRARSIRDWVFERHKVPYNIEVFEEGRRKLKTIEISAARVDKKNKNVLYVAPWFYVEIKEHLEKQGFRFIEEFEKPDTTPILDIQDIEHMLRPYQREALEKWIENGYRGSIALPTGAGKTWVGLGAIAKLRVRTVIFVPTINLALQWKEDFLKKVLGLADEHVGILGGGYHELGKPVLVCTYDSGVKYAREIAKLYAFFIFDEGHHVAAESFKEIAWHALTPYRMVLSATVERDDQNEAMIYRMCGKKVYEKSFYELVKEGWLSPVNVEFLEVPLPDDEKRKYEELERELMDVKEKLKELYRRYEAEAEKNGFIDVRNYLRSIKHPEFRELNSRALSLVQRMRMIEQRNSNKVVKAIELASRFIEEGRHVFVFTNLEDQAQKIYEELVKRYGEKVAIVTGKTSVPERDMIFRLFREGKVRCIVTTTVLDEGIDAPSADVAIVVSSRAIKHPRQFVQRIGRIVRPMPDKIAHVVIMRTTGVRGAEERTIRELYSELDRIYEFSKMRELIEARKKLWRLVFEAKAVLERAGRGKGHTSRIVMYHSALRDFIGRKVHVKVYAPDGRLVKETDLKVAEKKCKGYVYGKLSISLPTDYAGERMVVEVYPF